MYDKLIFILLAEEFGGTKFGPFDAPEIRFGSDRERTDIHVPASLGVLPEHVKVIRQKDHSFILAPTERAAGIFVWRQGSRPKQITSPVAIQSGDGFSLVTEQGPRFYVVVEDPPPSEKKKPKQGLAAARGRLSGGGLINEIKRRGFASVVSTGIGHTFQNAWTFIKTGTILQPRYIIAGVLMMSGWLVAGGASCAAFKLNLDLGSSQETITELQGDNALCGIDDDDDPTLYSTTETILHDPEWDQTLMDDKLFTEAYGRKLRSVFNKQEDYRWVYTQTHSEYTELRVRLENEGLPPDVIRVLAYAAAKPRAEKDREWVMITEDSLPERTCGRGPLQLSYRQGLRMGLEEVQLDALVEGTVADSENIEPKREALMRTASRAGVADRIEFDNDQVNNAGAELQGGSQCLYVEGEDHRTSINKLADSLASLAGSSASGVPAQGADFWIASRLVRLYATDFDIGYEELDFSQDAAPSVVLEDSTDAQRRFAIDRAAELLARSVAIPCLAKLDRELTEDPEHMGELPTLFQCFALSYLMAYGEI